MNLTVTAEERKALADVPNALGYQRIIETSTNGYLVRQYLYNSLYDRLRYDTTHIRNQRGRVETYNPSAALGRS